MALRLALAAALVAVAAVAAWRLERRPRTPTAIRDRAHVPAQLDRSEFPRPEAPWLVVLFSSTECGGCADMVSKVAVLETSDVAVARVEYTEQKDVHERYGIEAVPLVVVVDTEGVTHGHKFGNVPAPEVWALVTAARGDSAPGS